MMDRSGTRCSRPNLMMAEIRLACVSFYAKIYDRRSQSDEVKSKSKLTSLENALAGDTFVLCAKADSSDDRPVGHFENPIDCLGVVALL